MINFQILCEECNKIKTKNDMASLVVDRKLTKVIGRNGSILDNYNC
jgi:hypothetical protein